MADDATPIFPDQAVLTERARKAGVDLTALSDLARIRLLREFRTQDEKRALLARAHAEMAEDAKLYSAHLEENGFWNAGIKPW